MMAVAWTPEVVAMEVLLDGTHTRDYVGAMHTVILIKILSYYIVAGSMGVKRGPAHLLELFWEGKQHLEKLFSYLVDTRNSRTWLSAICVVFDPGGYLKMRQALERKTHAIAAFIYSILVNVSGPVAPQEASLHLLLRYFPLRQAHMNNSSNNSHIRLKQNPL